MCAKKTLSEGKVYAVSSPRLICALLFMLLDTALKTLKTKLIRYYHTLRERWRVMQLREFRFDS